MADESSEKEKKGHISAEDEALLKDNSLLSENIEKKQAQEKNSYQNEDDALLRDESVLPQDNLNSSNLPQQENEDDALLRDESVLPQDNLNSSNLPQQENEDDALLRDESVLPQDNLSASDLRQQDNEDDALLRDESVLQQDNLNSSNLPQQENEDDALLRDESVLPQDNIAVIISSTNAQDSYSSKIEELNKIWEEKFQQQEKNFKLWKEENTSHFEKVYEEWEEKFQRQSGRLQLLHRQYQEIAYRQKNSQSEHQEFLHKFQEIQEEQNSQNKKIEEKISLLIQALEKNFQDSIVEQQNSTHKKFGDILKYFRLFQNEENALRKHNTEKFVVLEQKIQELDQQIKIQKKEQKHYISHVKFWIISFLLFILYAFLVGYVYIK